MKQAFYICTLALAFAACKKHDSPSPINNNESAAERLTGSYVGVTHFRYKNTNSMGIFQDSSIRTDTFIVSRIAPDTVLLNRPEWDITIPGFVYDASGNYYRKRGTTAFNDHMDELTITFNDAAPDSIYIMYHSVMVGSNILDRWTEFRGKK